MSSKGFESLNNILMHSSDLPEGAKTNGATAHTPHHTEKLQPINPPASAPTQAVFSNISFGTHEAVKEPDSTPSINSGQESSPQAEHMVEVLEPVTELLDEEEDDMESFEAPALMETNDLEMGFEEDEEPAMEESYEFSEDPSTRSAHSGQALELEDESVPTMDLDAELKVFGGDMPTDAEFMIVELLTSVRRLAKLNEVDADRAWIQAQEL